MQKNKSILINTGSALLFQAVSAVCGLILPRFILLEYGSAVNGAVSSIIRFLSYISLMQFGIGAVIKAALYRPLAEGNDREISGILRSSRLFFRKIGLVLAVYALLIALVYPLLVQETFDYFFVFSLVLVLSVSAYADYVFGISYQFLLYADDRAWLINITQSATMLFNLLLGILLIQNHASIHAVKLATVAIYAIRPLVYYLYVKRHYRPDRNAPPDTRIRKSHMDGFYNQISHFMHFNVAVLLLTLFAPITEVSAFAVYAMVVTVIQNLILAPEQTMNATLGNLFARGEKRALSTVFGRYEALNAAITFSLFTVTAILICPFVMIYTSGVTDTEYYRPLFAFLLVGSEAMFCLRMPYSNMVITAGHFRETRFLALGETLLKIALGLVLVFPLGAAGIALASLIAVALHTVTLLFYLRKNILERPIFPALLHLLANALASGAAFLVFFGFFPLPPTDSYGVLILQAVTVTAVTLLLHLLSNLLFFPKDTLHAFSALGGMLRKKKSAGAENRTN